MPQELQTADPDAKAEDFRQALLSVRDNNTRDAVDTYLKMLKLQHASPDHATTAAQMAEGMGFAREGVANLKYGKLGHEIADNIGFVPPNRPDGKKDPMWWMTLSTGTQKEDEHDGNMLWTMRPAFVEALLAMGWVRAAK